MPFAYRRFGACLLAAAAALPVTAERKTVDSKYDIRAAGMRIAAALNERDAPAFERMIDFESFGEAVMRDFDLGLNERDRADFERGLLSAGPRIAETSVRRLEDGKAVAHLLRAERRHDDWDVLLRLTLFDDKGEPAGFDYIQFELGGDDRIDDWRSEAMAGQASAQVRLVTAMMLPESRLLSGLFGSREVDEDLLRLFQQLRGALAVVDNPKAFEVLGRMPAEVRATRFWATYRVALASNLGDEIYRASLDHLAQHFGSDPELDFMLVDHAWFRGEFRTAIERLESFEQRVVEDGTTTLLKCGAANEIGDHRSAAQFCRRSVALEPGVENAWWALAGIGITEKDAALVLEALTGIETHFDTRFDIDALVDIPDYAWLAGTAELKAWDRSRQAPSPTKP